MKQPDHSTGTTDHFMRFSRREFIKTSLGAGLAFGAGLTPVISLANNPVGQKLHGLSSFGDLKYPIDYPHFDYVSLDAPKGGAFAFSPSNWGFNQNTQTFNTLNSFILKGEAPPRLELIYDTLMTGTLDEPDSIYGALAKTVEISQDRNTYTFELRPEARFHDGTPLTAHDVAFSYLLLKDKGHPQLAADLVDLQEANALSDHVFEMKLNGKQSDRAILTLATLVPVFSKAFYEKLPFEEHVLETPLGSGAYKVGRVSPGNYIEYERVEDYWAKDLPFAIGVNHFDTIRIDFFRERQAAFEAFKKGDVRWREEFTSKTWATEYDFPAIKEGNVLQLEFPDEKRPSLQGWAVNSRREKFADPRTRKAIGMVFDFEWTNKNIFYDAYQRRHSMFEQSDFAAEGLPSPAELALLEPLRSQLPESVFGEAVMQYVSTGRGKDRKAFRAAQKLLIEAEWKREGDFYIDANGNRLEVEFLTREQTFDRILGPYIENLKTLGIPANIRLVDPSQFQAKIESFDFDIVGMAMNYGATPTREGLRQVFHSQSADQQGSRNYPGTAIPALDTLIDQLNAVNDRQELQTVMKAVDRVLRAHHFWIPNWFAANHRIATWDMFGWKDPKPDYGFPVESLWWFDEKKAAAIKS